MNQIQSHHTSSIRTVDSILQKTEKIQRWSVIGKVTGSVAALAAKYLNLNSSIPLTLVGISIMTYWASHQIQKQLLPIKKVTDELREEMMKQLRFSVLNQCKALPQYNNYEKIANFFDLFKDSIVAWDNKNENLSSKYTIQLFQEKTVSSEQGMLLLPERIEFEIDASGSLLFPEAEKAPLTSEREPLKKLLDIKPRSFSGGRSSLPKFFEQ